MALTTTLLAGAELTENNGFSERLPVRIFLILLGFL